MATPLITVNAQPSSSSSSFASQSSFAQKILNFTFTLTSNPQSAQPATFSGTNSNQLSVSGVRAQCRITNASPPSASSADIKIFGLPQSVVNQLSTLVPVEKLQRNTILVNAGVSSTGDASAAAANAAPASGFPVVFGGTISYGVGDYSNMPDCSLHILAQAGLIEAVIPAKPSSFPGQTSVVAIMQNFANLLNVGFENNGVTTQISNPYYPGTIMQQIYQCAYHAGINAQLVDGGTKLAIWPQPGSRTSQTNIPLVSAQTGMVGYPLFTPTGYLIVKMIYNPSVIYGGNIQIQSSIQPANRTWSVYGLNLALDTLVPGGEWMATVLCYPQGLTAPVPPTVAP